jgi:hypothetical protein
MDAALKKMFTFRQTRDLGMAALKDARPGHPEVRKAAGTFGAALKVAGSHSSKATTCATLGGFSCSDSAGTNPSLMKSRDFRARADRTPQGKNCDKLCAISRGCMSIPPPPARLLRFDTFELDLRAGKLHKRGVKLRLQS